MSLIRYMICKYFLLFSGLTFHFLDVSHPFLQALPYFWNMAFIFLGPLSQLRPKYFHIHLVMSVPIL